MIINIKINNRRARHTCMGSRWHLECLRIDVYARHTRINTISKLKTSEQTMQFMRYSALQYRHAAYCAHQRRKTLPLWSVTLVSGIDVIASECYPAGQKILHTKVGGLLQIRILVITYIEADILRYNYWHPCTTRPTIVILSLA